MSDYQRQASRGNVVTLLAAALAYAASFVAPPGQDVAAALAIGVLRTLRVLMGCGRRLGVFRTPSSSSLRTTFSTDRLLSPARGRCPPPLPSSSW